MRVTLAGHVHLARMVDKCRAVLAGTEGEYLYPCPLDKRLLEFAGITDMEFTSAVKTYLTDEGIAQWFEAKSKPHPPAALRKWNEMMLTRGPSTPEKQDYFNNLRAAVDPSRTDLTSWADLQDLEERRSVPRREPAK